MNANANATVSAVGLMEALLALGRRDGVVPICRLPGLYHRVVDARWELWVNPQRREQPVPGRVGQRLLPGELYVEYNGWPWGVISLGDGDGVVGDGSGANLPAFIAALKAAAEGDAA